MFKIFFKLIILCFIALFLSGCVDEEYNLTLPDNTIHVQSFNNEYNLISRETNGLIGSSHVNLQLKEGVVYNLFYNLKINWISRNNQELRELKIDSKSVIDRNFKLKYFVINLVNKSKESEIFNINKSFQCEGHYNYPYLYIKKNNKKSRIFAPKGIFSSIVEEYIIRHELKIPGDAVTYHFFNLSSLEVEEERIQFEEKQNKKIDEKNIPVKLFRVINYTQGYNSTIWTDYNNKILRKTDFKEAVLWKLKDLKNDIN